MAIAVIIAPRPEVRTGLERLFRELPRFAGASGFSTTAEARSTLLRQSVTPDFVFLSDDLGIEEISNFTEAIRDTKHGKRITFVGILKFGSAEEEKIAEFLASGAHGILREPITMQALEEVLDISRTVRYQGTRIRLKTAAALFLASAVDKMTREQGMPTEQKDLMTKVRDACRDYKRLTGSSLTMDAISDDSRKLKEYTGISRRVREIYELRLKSLIGKLFQVQDRTPSGKLKSVK